MNTYYPRQRTRNRSHPRRWLVFGVLILMLLGAFYWFVIKDDQKKSESKTSQTSEAQKEPETPRYTPINVQPTIDAWVAQQSATYSIVVYDPQAKQTTGSHLPDEEYFAASLYKLFVAYLALEDFESGGQNPDDILISGTSRKQCVDKMIRESHSPCGEAMMADMGPQQLTDRVKAMGITGTYFNGIRTTAKDSALILQYILEKRDLNEANTAFLLDAMRIQDQKFRNGLAKGAPNATWETKVGWNQEFNYHDVGIMTVPDGRKFVVAILSEGNGQSAPIADFAGTLYAALNP